MRPRDTDRPGGARAAGEFSLIDRHLARLGAARGDVVLGVGDDGAIVSPPPGARLQVEVESVAPRDGEPATGLVRRALAGPVERLERRGATPAWATLALTLDQADEGRIAALAAALDEAASAAGVSVVGGDTTRGPDRLTVCVIGPAPDGGR